MNAIPPIPFQRPCAPTATATLSNGPRWVHEPKLDGWRLQIIKDVAGVRLLTRKGANYTKRLPIIATAVAALKPRRLVLDAELCSLRPDSSPDFHALQATMRSKHPNDSALAVFIFDVLHIDDEDLRRLPLTDRRKKLERILRRARAPLFLTAQFDDGPKLLEHCNRHGLEGVVSKLRDSSYRSGPSRAWRKIKCDAWRKEHRERWRTFTK